MWINVIFKYFRKKNVTRKIKKRMSAWIWKSGPKYFTGATLWEASIMLNILTVRSGKCARDSVATKWASRLEKPAPVPSPWEALVVKETKATARVGDRQLIFDMIHGTASLDYPHTQIKTGDSMPSHPCFKSLLPSRSDSCCHLRSKISAILPSPHNQSWGIPRNRGRWSHLSQLSYNFRQAEV